MSSTSNVKHTASEDRDVSMRLFSVEWLGQGQLVVERDDGITISGTPDKVLPLLNFVPLVLKVTV